MRALEQDSNMQARLAEEQMAFRLPTPNTCITQSNNVNI